jgi:hypothetical protein
LPLSKNPGVKKAAAFSGAAVMDRKEESRYSRSINPQVFPDAFLPGNVILMTAVI